MQTDPLQRFYKVSSGNIVGTDENGWKNNDLQFILEPLDVRVRVKLMQLKSFIDFDSKTRTSRAIRFIFIMSYLFEAIPRFHVLVSFHVVLI